MSSAKSQYGFASGSRGHDKAEELYRERLKLQSKNQDPQKLDHTQTKEDQDVTGTRYGQETMGQFLRKDAKDIEDDTLVDLWRAIPHNSAEWGQKIMPPDLPEKILKKTKDQEYLNMLNFVSNAAVDLDDPDTQEYLYNMAPELKYVPDQYVEQVAGTQLFIRNLLRDGKIRGKKDLLVVWDLLNPNRDIPLAPIWDSSGIILDTVLSSTTLKDLIQTSWNSEKTWNNPFDWWSAASEDEKKWQTGIEEAYKNELQRKLKIMLVRRLFPKYRKNIDRPGKPVDDIIWEDLKAAFRGTPATLDQAISYSFPNINVDGKSDKSDLKAAFTEAGRLQKSQKS